MVENPPPEGASTASVKFTHREWSFSLKLEKTRCMSAFVVVSSPSSWLYIAWTFRFETFLISPALIFVKFPKLQFVRLSNNNVYVLYIR